MTSLTKDLGRQQNSIQPQFVPPKPTAWQKTWRYVQENAILFLLGAPAVILIFFFSYIPMMGTVIAFQDYSPKTMFLSPWVGLRNFRLLVESPLVIRLVVNTLQLNAMFIIATTFFAVVTALLINEVRSVPFKRLTQSVLFLAFFYGLDDCRHGTLWADRLSGGDDQCHPGQVWAWNASLSPISPTFGRGF